MTYLNIILTILCITLISYPVIIFYLIKKYRKNFMGKFNDGTLQSLPDKESLKKSMEQMSEIFKNFPRK